LKTDQPLFIIPSFNDPEKLKICVESIIRHEGRTVFIYIVDDCSEQTNYNKILIQTKTYENVSVIRQNINSGFGQTINAGFRYGILAGFKAFIILNQDVELICKISDELRAYWNATIGITSPISLNKKGNICKEQDLILKKQGIDDISQLKEKHIDIRFINAALWYIDIETLEKIGGFHPLFHMYGEDQNYCDRIIQHGLRIVIIPSLKVIHNKHPELYIENRTLTRKVTSSFHLSRLLLSRKKNRFLNEIFLLAKYSLSHLIRGKIGLSFIYLYALSFLWLRRMKIKKYSNEELDGLKFQYILT
jgi:GT2 family glycosyltransferase